ncbi:MAG: hypothetical protein MSH18_05800 [Bacteroidales bacterium]|nr:hypothetical protein [Bacteroidales bacterium]
MKLSLLLLASLTSLTLSAQTDSLLHAKARSFFSAYYLKGYRPSKAMGLERIAIDEEEKTLRLYANEAFCAQTFTEESVKAIYTNLKATLPAPFSSYKIEVVDAKERAIESLIPNALRTNHRDRSRLWGTTNYTGNAWVRNVSKPFNITAGLDNRHLCLWHSHGRYYRAQTGLWEWQRPNLFCTTEDLLTQSFVLPYLMPMLENAGAILATPRERDRQREEVIVDNDRIFPNAYMETSQGRSFWQNTPTAGFAPPFGAIGLAASPFTAGTARMAETSSSEKHLAKASWHPLGIATGDYAVYVSYQTLSNSTDEAHYTVHHAGGDTEIIVNQQIGGGTWVYLGTFRFTANASQQGVSLSNVSKHGGVVVADGVRFGGGMGIATRGSAGTSGLPRFLEAARYNAQWSGMPDSLWNKDAGTNDYNDDIRSRPNYLNWLAGSSIYLPNHSGKGVPLELSLAIHSDAGVRSDNSIYGSLAIYTTADADNRATFPEGMARQASGDLGALMLMGLRRDLSASFGIDWTQRELWDRNYGETRIPYVPSLILETLSHQNFMDMRYAHDPLFKFALARSVYKTILRYIHSEHNNRRYVVQPLPVHNFSAIVSDGHAQLSWQPQEDSLEPTATPDAYVVYTRCADGGFDNGVVVNGTTTSIPIPTGVPYSFKVTAINKGGESFPSEILSVCQGKAGSKSVLIVNAFDRLSGPALVQTYDSLGFDLKADYGIPYLYTTAFSGAQQNFNPSQRGREGNEALGFSGSELEGQELAGNTFDYPALHGSAIAAAGFTYSSVSREALLSGSVDLNHFAVIDYIGGFQKDATYNLRSYPLFPKAVQEILRGYTQRGGRLLVSGAYLGSELRTNSDSTFAADVLKYAHGGRASFEATDSILGANFGYTIYRKPNSEQIAVMHPEVLLPMGKSFSTVTYSDGRSAGIAYQGTDYRVVTLGFPFETIKESRMRQATMRAILGFLTQ